ncbi:TIM barrel protein [Nocardia arizonensis]|uniref:TIM barrel protein n=1 Tax=Nocardia arizonensis TaxID=1141647 RepID=UPI0006D02CBD|nr:TIM barrel protein [Nocardia arizonensis]
MSEALHPPPRIAAAPISWGVCEVPGWGAVLDAPTVLAEMAALGITATEFGPPGYLPHDPGEIRALLGRYGIRGIGGFLAHALHTDPAAAVETARITIDRYAAAGAEVLVLAAATGAEGYDARAALSESEWRTLLATAATIAELAADRGLRTVMHPHVGTHIETESQIERFLADSPMELCLDTGHILVGGGDPVRSVRRYADRVGHVHLKDVRAAVLAEVGAGTITYTEAVRRGLYAPLGAGDIDIAALLTALRDSGYGGWYVVEQDTALRPGESAREPSRAAARSLEHLARLLVATRSWVQA